MISLLWVFNFFSFGHFFFHLLTKFSISWNCLRTALLCLDFRYFANSLTSNVFNSSIVFPLYVNSFLFSSIFYPFLLPVLLGLNDPTLLPGGAFLFAILLFILFPLPEPNGWSITFIFTADVLGHNFPLAFVI